MQTQRLESRPGSEWCPQITSCILLFPVVFYIYVALSQGILWVAGSFPRGGGVSV